MRLEVVKWVVLVIIVLAVGGGVLFLKTRPLKVAPALITSEVPEQTFLPVVKTIGVSVEGRNISSYTYGTGMNQLVFVGGIHGGYEWNSVLLAYQLIDYLKANPQIIPTNLAITIIPSLNPDGVYKVTGKEGRFTEAEVTTDAKILAAGRFNAHEVDLNRNFDCKWQPKSRWQNKTVSAGTKAFSEPEASALKRFIEDNQPAGVVFWHSQANSVYASECGKGILATTTTLVNLYAKASGYAKANSFSDYEITGDVTDWLASLNIPAITVELKTHENIEWDKNLAAVKVLLNYFNQAK